MKKILVLALVLTFAFSLTIQAKESVSADIISQQVEEVPQKMVGFDFPSYGWVETNEAGEITGYEGFNLGLGYSKKNYYEAGLEVNRWNNYWGWGTTLILIPYGEIGTEYVFEPNSKGDFWTAGAGIGVYNLFPTVKLTASYHF
ncbi:MAG: hypothetical protein R6V17_05830 [Halanaerobacter sp.]